MQTYIHTCMHAYIHSFIHTCIHMPRGTTSGTSPGRPAGLVEPMMSTMPLVMTPNRGAASNSASGSGELRQQIEALRGQLDVQLREARLGGAPLISDSLEALKDSAIASLQAFEKLAASLQSESQGLAAS